MTPEHTGRRTTLTNWVLALLTIPGAAAAMFFAYGAVLGTSACSAQACEHLPSETAYTVMLYGPPVIAVVAVVLSFFTARLPRGYLVPVVAWILLIVDVVVMFFAFQH
ncbi:hypothetical protein [Mycolicibacterium komossense]|uniref:Integral membrane protein n=1 Tax=Mycolicibacterium komossense TaxID=1779 RepID=A0ABT3C8U5_9MYCO|nr:hypothetical protein [Mycolicibacterium komossense]MCV7225872.1 hypothetical protein [Mycolicibacterium komossense]